MDGALSVPFSGCDQEHWPSSDSVAVTLVAWLFDFVQVQLEREPLKDELEGRAAVLGESLAKIIVSGFSLPCAGPQHCRDDGCAGPQHRDEDGVRIELTLLGRP